MSGVIEINGVKHKVVCWAKTSAAGKPYFQVAEDKKPAQPSSPSPYGGGGWQQQPQKGGNEFSDPDDSIPF